MSTQQNLFIYLIQFSNSNKSHEIFHLRDLRVYKIVEERKFFLACMWKCTRELSQIFFLQPCFRKIYDWLVTKGASLLVLKIHYS